MADDLTPAEKAQKEVDEYNKENERLREQIAKAESDLSTQVQVDSINLTRDLVADENARLKAQLESMREQVKAQKAAASPAEQAQAAAEEAVAAQAAPPIADNTKAKE